jgi:hypothetical protein
LVFQDMVALEVVIFEAATSEVTKGTVPPTSVAPAATITGAACSIMPVSKIR